MLQKYAAISVLRENNIAYGVNVHKQRRQLQYSSASNIALAAAALLQ
jgi:hypothetical protein